MNIMCNNKLGCACDNYLLKQGPSRQIHDLVGGGFSCVDGEVKKRKRGAKPRWCSRPGWRSTSRRGTAGTISSRRTVTGRRLRVAPSMEVVAGVQGDGAHGGGGGQAGASRTLPGVMEGDSQHPHGDGHDDCLAIGRGVEVMVAEVLGDGAHGEGGDQAGASHTQPGVGGDGRYHIADGREDCQDVGKEILIHKSFTPRRPKDFTTVKKRGIVPDGLVQSKLAGFIAKYPELRIEGRGVKRKCGDGVQNDIGVPNV
jgi:hypothetical protein